MAVYKVIQDVEAEDKLLGPLTLKGFIYAITAGFLVFVCVKIAITNTGGNYRFIVIFLLFWPILLLGTLASPLGREQPTEVWLLSHIRFFFKPKARLWNQQGQQELVTITAPKKPDLHLVKEISQPEVHSRLETLALTMDSRGWVVKNAYADVAGTLQSSDVVPGQDKTDDRLVARTLTSGNPGIDVHASDDVLDLQNSPRAQHVESLMQQKAMELKEQRFSNLDTLAKEAQRPAPAIISRSDHMVEVKKPPSAVQVPVSPPVPAPTPQQAAKFQNLAKSNDVTVASVAAMASAPEGPHITKIAPGEVEISLR